MATDATVNNSYKMCLLLKNRVSSLMNERDNKKHKICSATDAGGTNLHGNQAKQSQIYALTALLILFNLRVNQLSDDDSCASLLLVATRETVVGLSSTFRKALKSTYGNQGYKQNGTTTNGCPNLNDFRKFFYSNSLT